MENNKISYKELAYIVECFDEEIEDLLYKLKTVENGFIILEKIINGEGL